VKPAEGQPLDCLLLDIESRFYPDSERVKRSIPAQQPDVPRDSTGAGNSRRNEEFAACQCFHDRDNSGRGILMETTITYAAEKKWYAPKK
jgi:hypothetical protein